MRTDLLNYLSHEAFKKAKRTTNTISKIVTLYHLFKVIMCLPPYKKIMKTTEKKRSIYLRNKQSAFIVAIHHNIDITKCQKVFSHFEAMIIHPFPVTCLSGLWH